MVPTSFSPEPLSPVGRDAEDPPTPLRPSPFDLLPLLVFLACVVAAFVLTPSYYDPPATPETPTKEQVVHYVQAKVGEEKEVLWYLPYRPETQAHGTTADPARSFVGVQEAGYCFLHDLRTHASFLVDCRAEPPKGSVTP